MTSFLKKTNKLILAALGALLLMIPLQAIAENDTPVTFQQLPSKAQEFINTHFSASDILLATLDNDFMDKTYKVRFKNGSELEFLKNGEWKEVDCKASPVPAKIVDARIAAKIKELYPDTFISEIQKDRGYTEVKLSNRLELKFNKSAILVEVDD